MIFVSFSVIQVGIAEPELANSSLGVLAFEVFKPRSKGLRLEARAYQYCEGLSQVGLWPNWNQFNQEDKFTEKQDY